MVVDRVIHRNLLDGVLLYDVYPLKGTRPSFLPAPRFEGDIAAPFYSADDRRFRLSDVGAGADWWQWRWWMVELIEW